MAENVIMDGTWGGDIMQPCATLLANNVNIVGVTSVFGNTNVRQATTNAHQILHLLNADYIPIYKGAKAQTGAEEPQEGDNAHHADGKGGAILDPVMARNKPPAKKYGSDNDAVNFILQEIEDKPGQVTIHASGPLTNIAQAIKLRPDIMAKVKRIIIMGGCTTAMAAHDVTPADTATGKDKRSGNITRSSEFNFYMAPEDAQTVMSSGLPITLMPMNCAHQLTVTPEREKAIRALIKDADALDAVLKMMTAPAALDRAKFNSCPFMYDVNCAFYLLHPELYNTERGTVTVATKPATTAQMHDLPYTLGDGREFLGHTEFSADTNGRTTVATGLKNPEAETADKLFDVLLASLAQCIQQEKKRAMY
jgi:purine nucleosidase